MSDLLREAAALAAESSVPGQRALVETCQALWRTAMVAKPHRLAAAISAAWTAEARVAQTPYAQACCLAAAKTWQARMPK